MLLKLFFPLIYFVFVVHAWEDIDCNDGGFYIRADPESAKHFYKCDNGRAVLFTCPDGLLYNPKLFVCDWPNNVEKTRKGTGTYVISNMPHSNDNYAQNSRPYSEQPEEYTYSNTKPSSENPWHYQSYSDDDEDLYPVYIIDNNMLTDEPGYQKNQEIDIR